VIDRMLDVGRARFESRADEEYETLRTDAGVLQTTMDDLDKTAIDYFTRRLSLTRQIATLEKKHQLYRTRTHLRDWDCMSAQLYNKPNHHIGRLVICNRIMGRDTESFHTDPDKCTKCGLLYVFDNVTNVHICEECGFTVDVLFISEDTSHDVLITREPNTGSAVSVRQRTSDYQYVRSPLYRRYLGQFGEDMPEIPTDVMRVLYKYLSNIHLQNSIRCRPTPVGNIMRTHGFSKWAHLAIRITKIFNGDPVPVIASDLIDRLVARFDLIFKEATRQKKKLPSFEFITNILLRVEGRQDIASCFVLHKTRAVLVRISTSLYEIIDAVRELDRSMAWEALPQF
tara:strand:+ start:1215 stop:2240 length:1026 start_codon:yes stop_codon:yes gene_type:complete